VGDTVIKLGYPLGVQGASSVTLGVVSSLWTWPRTQAQIIQTDAAINQGDSGGALLDGRGNLIGINSFKFVGAGIEGVGFGVGVNEFKDELDRMIKGELVCPPAPASVGGTTFVHNTIGYSVIIPEGSYWAFEQYDDTSVAFFDKAGYAGMVIFYPVLRGQYPTLQSLADTWAGYLLATQYRSIDITNTRPTCVPGIGEALELEAIVEVREAVIYQERWLVFFDGGLGYFLEGWSRRDQWKLNEKFIDTMLFSFKTK
jgi:hypothetical protein